MYAGHFTPNPRRGGTQINYVHMYRQNENQLKYVEPRAATDSETQPTTNCRLKIDATQSYPHEFVDRQ